MALRNVPFRSEVLAWDPDSLADYFRKVSLALWWWGAGSALGEGGGQLDRGLKVESRQNAKGMKDSSELPASQPPHQLGKYR